MVASLDALSSADRGFVTWLATMVREAPDVVWKRIVGGDGTKVDGRHLTALDLSPIGAQLRWVAGPERRLSLPIAGLDRVAELDCSGLDLDVLDVRLLPALRVLRCADNRLRELDLSPCKALEVLDCSRNVLMVLDLRANESLREIACADNGLGVLVLPAGGVALERVDASRNHLMVLEVGQRPALRELRCDRNALVRLDLHGAPELVTLDVGHNELARLPLPPLPKLARLSLGRNQLDVCAVDGFPALAELDCHGNYVASLDLRGLAHLVKVDAHANQLVRVDLGDAARLVELDLSDNRIERLDLGTACTRLEILDLADNHLRTLAVDGCPALRSVEVSNNPLTTFDPRSAKALAVLGCARTQLTTLDITENGRLLDLRTLDPSGRGPTVVATPNQERRLRELREARGLGTGKTEIAELDRFELHDLARTVGGRDADERLMAIVTSPQCDLGTASMVYWSNVPQYYLRYPGRAQVPPYELAGYDLLAAIVARATDGGYATADIPYDPTDDRTRAIRGQDRTQDFPPDALAGVPAVLVRPVVPFDPRSAEALAERP